MMSVVYSKVKISDNIFEACKLIRNSIGLPIGEIKNKIQKGEVLIRMWLSEFRGINKNEGPPRYP